MTSARARRSAKAVLVLLCIAFNLAGPGIPALGGGTFKWKSSEKCMMRKINYLRVRDGLRPLNWDKQLGYVARDHANHLAAHNGLWHDQGMYDEITRWRRLGQNTGRGGKCRHLFQTFRHSSAHRSNMLDNWRYVGVGAEWRNGRLFVQQIFESRRNPGNIYHRP